MQKRQKHIIYIDTHIYLEKLILVTLYFLRHGVIRFTQGKSPVPQSWESDPNRSDPEKSLTSGFWSGFSMKTCFYLRYRNHTGQWLQKKTLMNSTRKFAGNQSENSQYIRRYWIRSVFFCVTAAIKVQHAGFYAAWSLDTWIKGINTHHHK